MRRIEPTHVWIGHAGDGRDFRALFDRDIRAVVQLALEEPPIVAPRELIVLRFPLVDGEGNEEWLLRLAVDAVSRLISIEIPTLVCCGAGMSRAPAIVATALANVQQSSAAACLASVTARSPADVSPVLWQELTSAMRR
ncbi:MAG: protein phosphatase [Planctomycetaceae bacterium]